MLTGAIIKQLPKVELHDHLDGGVRVETIIELANNYGIALPSTDPKALHDWFAEGGKQKSLTLYLQAFGVTTGVMQTKEALKRIAFEAVEDLADDHVCYAEIRFAPILHTAGGLTMEECVQAVLDGLDQGTRQTGVPIGLILCAMRNQSPAISLEVAKLAVAFADRGVVGFDLAGDEAGNPPKKHLDAFQFIRSKNFNITLHAGEAFGIESIWQAVQICGSHRIGHGVRLVEDMMIGGSKILEMGSLANYILDRRIPMEMCLSSNVGTGAAASLGEHPFPILFRNRFRVFLCVDNRLMSDTTLSKEMELAVEYYNLTIRDLEKITINAMKSAFIHHEERLKIIYDVIKPGYARIRDQYGFFD
ncbi:MAG TPA: adenosine deaminase [Sphaerochaeta sp.]|nr:adenosine deaminase [Sphaerochaeta sp.]